MGYVCDRAFDFFWSHLNLLEEVTPRSGSLRAHKREVGQLPSKEKEKRKKRVSKRAHL